VTKTGHGKIAVALADEVWLGVKNVNKYEQIIW